jgi:GT2 family glycosyltransferase
MTRPDVSIVIVSFNAQAHLERCLDSLHTAPPRVSHEILVVDNASQDASAQAASRYPRVEVVVLDRNMGFAIATNVGIRRSRGSKLLLLNSDTIWLPRSINTRKPRLSDRAWSMRQVVRSCLLGP